MIIAFDLFWDLLFWEFIAFYKNVRKNVNYEKNNK